MRILFSSTPAVGHLLPMLPLAQACQDAGHDVAVLTDVSLSEMAGGIPLVPAGPDLGTLLVETHRRTGIDPLDPKNPPVPSAEFFAGVRPDLTFAPALEAAQDFAPDLLICEIVDFVGPLVAASLHAPWAAHGLTLGLPADLTRSMESLAASRFADRHLEPTPRAALIDPWPELLNTAGWTPEPDRIPIRPSAHQPVGSRWRGRTQARHGSRPLVLVTLGTSVTDVAVFQRVLDQLVEVEADIVVTVGPGTDPTRLDVDPDQVQVEPFVPLGLLLDQADVVVSASGAGTVLGTLSRGLPMVLMPMVTDQPAIAARVAEQGAAVVVDDFSHGVGGAVRRSLESSEVRDAAQRVARQMARLPSPAEVLAILETRLSSDKR